jgi:hypothetical protein
VGTSHVICRRRVGQSWSQVLTGSVAEGLERHTADG